MAAPIVSGAAALIWAQRPKLKNHQVKQILMESVDQIPALKGKVAAGGRLNILRALRHNRALANVPDKDLSQDSRIQASSVGGIRIFDARTGAQEKFKW